MHHLPQDLESKQMRPGEGLTSESLGLGFNKFVDNFLVTVAKNN